MIDPITAPILLKTLDWLFGEGSKILQERRERREAKREDGKEISETATPPAVPATTGGAILSKEGKFPADVTATSPINNGTCFRASI